MESNKKSSVKILFILIDGIADLNNSQIDNKTPLQYCNLPYINALANTGLNGMMDPVETGLACGSDTAHMNIFGYNPFELYRGRGAFESIGSGIPMDLTEVAFKCNFANMNPTTRVVEKRRVDRNFPEWGLPLIDVLNGMRVPGHEDHYITVLHATEHRCGVKLSGPNLSDEITGTDPLKDNLPLRKVVAKNKSNSDAVFTADLVNKLSDAIYDKLSQHPLNLEREKQGLRTGNIVLLRGCGSRLKVDDFEKVHGLKAFMIAPTAIINGLGQTIGIDPIKVPGTTGDYHTNLNLKTEKAAEIITSDKGYNFAFVHVKAIDDTGHDKDLEKKNYYFQKADEMIKTLIENLKQRKAPEEEFIICLTGDHTTPVRLGDHTFEPVPFTATTYSAVAEKLGIETSANVEKLRDLRDNVERFDEVSACGGVLGRFPGSQAMEVLKRFRESVGKLL